MTTTATTSATASPLYAVAGVTGHTGRRAAETLLSRGARVRVIVRDPAQGEAWAARGAEVAVADLWDEPALADALRGAAGAWLLSPPRVTSPDPLADAERLGRSFAAAIPRSGVGHVVLLSSVGAQHAAGTGPIRTVHHLEGVLNRLGVARTFVRPAYFLENWASSLGPARGDGVLPTFIPADLVFPQVATADIGRVAAEQLLAGPPADGRRVVELAGPEDLSSADVAALVGALLGRPVAPHAAPAAAASQVFPQFGLSQAVADLFAEMYAGVASGVVAFEGAPVRGSVTARETLAALLAG
ncbi:MAG: NmrA family NAD(P)-binding protein [Deltaproteobacteria bacterium]|nr:NmrA family NAD(P)-binding protein [Deltaproteobacteria bacterium]